MKVVDSSPSERFTLNLGVYDYCWSIRGLVKSVDIFFNFCEMGRAQRAAQPVIDAPYAAGSLIMSRNQFCADRIPSFIAKTMASVWVTTP